jgi:hypothetical protein
MAVLSSSSVTFVGGGTVLGGSLGGAPAQAPSNTMLEAKRARVNVFN